MAKESMHLLLFVAASLVIAGVMGQSPTGAAGSGGGAPAATPIPTPPPPTTEAPFTWAPRGPGTCDAEAAVADGIMFLQGVQLNVLWMTNFRDFEDRFIADMSHALLLNGSATVCIIHAGNAFPNWHVRYRVLRGPDPIVLQERLTSLFLTTPSPSPTAATWWLPQTNDLYHRKTSHGGSIVALPAGSVIVAATPGPVPMPTPVPPVRPITPSPETPTPGTFSWSPASGASAAQGGSSATTSSTASSANNDPLSEHLPECDQTMCMVYTAAAVLVLLLLCCCLWVCCYKTCCKKKGTKNDPTKGGSGASSAPRTPQDGDDKNPSPIKITSPDGHESEPAAAPAPKPATKVPPPRSRSQSPAPAGATKSAHSHLHPETSA